MKHINDNELMEYVAGRLASPEKEQVAEHIAGCPDCSQRRRQAAALWDSLGQWTVDTSGHEIAGRITALAQEHRSIRAFRRTGTPSTYALVLRVAASIIIAVAVGYSLGRSSVNGKMDTAATSKNRPAYLSALGLQWSSELAWLVLEDNSPSTAPTPEGEGR